MGVLIRNGWEIYFQSTEEILADFPDLEPEDIQACLLFAARRTEFFRLTA